MENLRDAAQCGTFSIGFGKAVAPPFVRQHRGESCNLRKHGIPRVHGKRPRLASASLENHERLPGFTLFETGGYEAHRPAVNRQGPDWWQRSCLGEGQRAIEG
jgi:hypothetical protein